jgi:hypothetical protein
MFGLKLLRCYHTVVDTHLSWFLFCPTTFVITSITYAIDTYKRLIKGDTAQRKEACMNSGISGLKLAQTQSMVSRKRLLWMGIII